VSSLPYPTSHALETAAEFHEARYEQALKALSPSNVLAAVDEMVAQIPNTRDHPLYALVVHCLRYGTAQSSGKRPHVSEMVGAFYEPLIDAAVTRLVEEKVGDDRAWEDSPWKSTQP
jgi:hypothetical protein